MKLKRCREASFGPAGAEDGIRHPVRFMWQPRMGWLLSGKPQKGEAGEEMFRKTQALRWQEHAGDTGLPTPWCMTERKVVWGLEVPTQGRRGGRVVSEMTSLTCCLNV